MNSKNSKRSDSNRLRLNYIDKKDLQRGDKHVALSDLSIYQTWKNIKKFYGNNAFKISGTTWEEKFELVDGSHFVSDFRDYFECIIKNYETTIDKSSVQIYVKKTQNRNTFKLLTGYFLIF